MESSNHIASIPSDLHALATERGVPIRSQIVHGTRYFYLDNHYWDSVKKRINHKREYIGHLNNNGIFIRNKKLNINIENAFDIDRIVESRRYFGVIHLLETISERICLKSDLIKVFPATYDKILSVAYFLISQHRAPFYKFDNWQLTHVHPNHQIMQSQRISDLLETINDDRKMQFFDLQIKRRLAEEYLAYDLTSVTSYTKHIKQYKHGHSKYNDNLPQVNLALVIGEKSYTPVYYKTFPGNINDVITINNLLKDLKYFNLTDLSFIMDRGFYSMENIVNIVENNHNFIVGIKNNLNIVTKSLPKARESINKNEYFLPEFGYYYHSKEIFISGKSPIKNFNISDRSRKRFFLHIYYKPADAAIEQVNFQQKLADQLEKFLNNQATNEETKNIQKYYSINKLEDSTFSIVPKTELINDHINDLGFFALLTNTLRDPNDVLRIYRNKDIVEKAFCNLKEKFKCQRKNMHSFENFEGVIFIQYIGLILLFHIHKTMKENNLYKNYTLEGLLDDLDLITRYQYNENEFHYGEITTKQLDLIKIFKLDEKIEFKAKKRKFNIT